MTGRAAGVGGSLALTLLTCVVAQAVEPPPAARVQRWTTREGLPQNSVNDLYEDDDGYLWVATFGGLTRFDGLRFRHYDPVRAQGLQCNRFLSLAGDDGALLVGTERGGLLKLRGGEFRRLPLGDHARGSAASVYNLRKGPDGVVWAQVDEGLVRFSDGTERPPELAWRGLVRDFVIARSGAVWVVGDLAMTCAAGPCRPGARSVAHWSGGLSFHPVEAPGGAVYVANDVGVAVLGADHLTQARTTEGAAGTVVHWRGAVWFGADGGLVRVDDGARIELPGDPGIEVHVSAARVGRDGSLWLGTSAAGLYQIRVRGARVVDAPAGTKETGAVAVSPSGEVWIHTRCVGVMPIARAQRARPPRPLIETGCLQDIAFDGQGRLWIGHETGSARLDLASGARADTEVRLRRFLRTSDGGLLAGTWGVGLHRLDGDSFVPAPELGPLGEAALPAAEAEDGTLWFIDPPSTIVRWRAGTASRFGPAEGLPAVDVRDVLPLDGGAWVSSYGGGLTWIGPDDRLGTFTDRHGLCENVSSGLLRAADYVWINGNRGVSRIRVSDLRGLASGARSEVRCALVDSGEGNGWDAAVAADGRLWFPTIHGVSIVDPEADRSASVAPVTNIERATLDGRPLPLSGEALTLEPGRGELVIEYTGIDLLEPRAVRFKYRLVPMDSEDVVAGWLDGGSAREVRYHALAPGRYRFDVSARGVSGDWSVPATVAVVVTPHFHQTIWFRGLIVLLLVGLLWGAVRWRLGRARHAAQELQRQLEAEARVRAELAEREVRYRTLFERTMDGLVLLTESGQVAEANPAACALVGVDRDTLRARGVLDFVAPDSRGEAEPLGEHAMGTVELELTRADGSTFEALVQRTPLEYQHAPHTLLVIRDVSAERRRAQLQKQLQRAQTLQAIGQLAGGVAHDFNNHLTVIGSHAWLLRAHADQGVAAQAVEIQETVERASALTSRLLLFAGTKAAAARDLDLATTLLDMPAMLRRLIREDIALRLEPDATATVHIDPVGLERIVVNLVVNARDAIERGGEIVVSTAVVDVGEVVAEIHGVAPGQYAVVAVRDDGGGMSEAVRARIFEPFFTTKEVGKGTGLGLATVHGTVTESGGFVTVSSALGVGTTFEVHLPIRAVSSPAAAPIVAPGPAPRRSARLLVIDDEPRLLRVVARILERAGHVVFKATEPHAAIELAARTEFDMIISDVVMPGMNGPELVARIRAAKGYAVPALHVSGHTRDIVIGEGVLTDLLSKPFEPAELLAQVDAILSRALPGANDAD